MDLKDLTDLMDLMDFPNWGLNPLRLILVLYQGIIALPPSLVVGPLAHQ